MTYSVINSVLGGFTTKSCAEVVRHIMANAKYTRSSTWWIDAFKCADCYDEYRIGGFKVKA